MIVPLTYEDIYDFKALQRQALRYRKEDTEGEKINWLQIRWLRFEKCYPDYISFKYSFHDEFKKMRVTENTHRKGVQQQMLRGFQSAINQSSQYLQKKRIF